MPNVCAKVNKNQLLLPLRMMVLYIIIGQYPKNTSPDFFSELRVEVIRLFVVDKKKLKKKIYTNSVNHRFFHLVGIYASIRVQLNKKVFTFLLVRIFIHLYILCHFKSQRSAIL